MRPGPILLLSSALLLVACAEVPECNENSRGDVVIDCSAGKVPVCGTDPALLYSENSGALLPVPPADVASGSCDGITGSCRPRPVCGAAGSAPTCANGETPACLLGRVTEIRTMMPTPDSGPPVEEDAGSTDEDAGTADEDAGTPADDAGTPADDAGSSTDAGTDAG